MPQQKTPRNRKPSKRSVFSFLQEQIHYKHVMNRFGTAFTYANAFRRFRDFRQGKDLTFAELTPVMMKQYEAWLVSRGLRDNTIRFYLRTLHTLFCKAINLGLLNTPQLFTQIRLSYVQTPKRAISETYLKAIQQIPLPRGSSIAFARDIFMFSFYMRGMAFVDIAYLKKSNLKYGTLSYCRKKTNQLLDIEWEPEQQAIVERYATQTKDSPYMFPIIQQQDGTEYQQYKRKQAVVNHQLKKLGQIIGLKHPLTIYVARHTWASIARNMDFPLAVISEGMGHRSYKTTQIYLDTIATSRVNDANRKIIQHIKLLK